MQHHHSGLLPLRDIPGFHSDQQGFAVTGTLEITQDTVIQDQLWCFGMLKPLNGVSLKIDGPFVAAAGQCFDLSAGGTIIGNPEVETVNPMWWGADPDYNGDSSAAINAAIAFCSGVFKPSVQFCAGNYKCLSQILKAQSFYLPIIRGTGGGNDKEPGGVVLNFSECEGDVFVKIRGGSGRTVHGGIADIEIAGNGSGIGLQIADQCGMYANNITVRGVDTGIEFFNETGFTEWNKLVGCQVDQPKKNAYAFRRGDRGLDSFHGAEILDCWTNLSPTSPAAIEVGAGCKWYNGTTRARVFFSGGLTNFQDVFHIDPNAVDVDTEGYIKTESGGGWGRGASGRNVNFAGPVLALTGITWGTLRPVKYSLGIGPEGGAANGVTVIWQEEQSYGPRFITVDENGDWPIGMNASGALDLEIIVTASNYEYRMSGIAHQQGYGGDGKFIPTAVWALNNSRGFGEPVLRVNSKHQIILRNAKYPAGEVKFYVWYRQRSLSVQTNQRFATMNP